MSTEKTPEIFQLSEVYKSGIHIPFSELFGKELKDYEDFNLSTKKTYFNQVKFFIQENNKVMTLDVGNEILCNYLMVSYKINKCLYKSPQQFIGAVVTEIFKPWFIERIRQYTEKMYKEKCTDIDATLKELDRKHNPSLVFNNEHAIILYRVAVMFRLIAPLATHFMYIYTDMMATADSQSLFADEMGTKYGSFLEAAEKGGKLFNKTQFLLALMKETIAVCTYDNPEMNIYGKLNHYTLSIIKGTSYSDQEMWSKLAMKSTNKFTLTDVIMTKLLIDILPKATFEKSVVKFIATTIEQHINWSLHQDFTISYNMITTMSDNSDFSDADKFEINSVKTNEFKKICSDNFTDDTINIIFRRKKFVLNLDEYNWYLANNDPISTIQESMVRNYFANPFGGYDNLDGVGKEQYTRLVCFLKHFLKDSGQFPVLSRVFTGRVTSMNEKRVLSRPIERKIKESVRYQNILQKYSYTGSMIEKSKVIESGIITILNATIVDNDFGSPTLGQEIEYDLTQICDEYMAFVEYI